MTTATPTTNQSDTILDAAIEAHYATITSAASDSPEASIDALNADLANVRVRDSLLWLLLNAKDPDHPLTAMAALMYAAVRAPAGQRAPALTLMACLAIATNSGRELFAKAAVAAYEDNPNHSLARTLTLYVATGADPTPVIDQVRDGAYETFRYGQA
jgi:hypothetical protein